MMSDSFLKTIFGRLTLDSFPIHEPILVATFIMVAIGGAAVLGALTYFKVWGYLWKEWFTSVDHKKIGVMYMVLGIVMLLRGFADALMMRAQQAMAFGANEGFLPAHHYDQVFTAHGVIMIFFVAMPLRHRSDELCRAAADRRARRVVPVPQQLQLLDDRGGCGDRHGQPVRRGVRPHRLAGDAALVGPRFSRPTSASIITSGGCRSPASAPCCRASTCSRPSSRCARRACR